MNAWIFMSKKEKNIDVLGGNNEKHYQVQRRLAFQ